MPCYETALAAYQAENWAQAFALLQRGAAAGETDCYNLLAICHEHGQGTAQNCRQAVRWYRHAIRAGDQSAVSNLADLLDKAGKAQRAEYWYRRAANNGGDEKLAYAEFLLRQNPAPTPAVIRLLRQAAARDIHTSKDAQARAAEWLQRFQAAHPAKPRQPENQQTPLSGCPSLIFPAQAFRRLPSPPNPSFPHQRQPEKCFSTCKTATSPCPRCTSPPAPRPPNCKPNSPHRT